MEDLYSVPSVTLAEALGNIPVQFIKLDVEGAEVKAINGYLDILRTANVANLFVEVSDACFERWEAVRGALRDDVGVGL